MKPALFITFFLSILCITAKSTIAQKTQVKDSLALVHFYFTMNGETWSNHSNWLETNVSDWYGVTIENGYVTRINLENNHLDGTIPEQLGELSELYFLNLDYNNIIGAIPFSILANVEFLEINNVSGFYPENTRENYVYSYSY